MRTKHTIFKEANPWNLKIEAQTSAAMAMVLSVGASGEFDASASFPAVGETNSIIY